MSPSKTAIVERTNRLMEVRFTELLDRGVIICAVSVVPDDDDLAVEDPGQHQRRQQRQQVEHEQQPGLARV